MLGCLLVGGRKGAKAIMCLYNASVSPSAGQLHQSGRQKLAAHHPGSCCQPDFISVLHNATVEHGISHFPPGHAEAADGDSVLCK